MPESCFGRMTSDQGCKNTNSSSWGATHLTSHGLWYVPCTDQSCTPTTSRRAQYDAPRTANN